MGVADRLILLVATIAVAVLNFAGAIKGIATRMARTY
jgi:hypothetical protein